MITAVGNVLENIDFIGKTINFRIGKSSGIKTSCGGVSTMMIIFILFCIFYVFVLPFIRRDDPDVTFYYIKQVFAKRFNLTNENYFLGYTLNYESGEALSEDELSLFEIKFTNFFKFLNADGTMNPEYPKYSNRSKLLNLKV